VYPPLKNNLINLTAPTINNLWESALSSPIARDLVGRTHTRWRRNQFLFTLSAFLLPVSPIHETSPNHSPLLQLGLDDPQRSLPTPTILCNLRLANISQARVENVLHASPTTRSVPPIRTTQRQPPPKPGQSDASASVLLLIPPRGFWDPPPSTQRPGLKVTLGRRFRYTTFPNWSWLRFPTEL